MAFTPTLPIRAVVALALIAWTPPDAVRVAGQAGITPDRARVSVDATVVDGTGLPVTDLSAEEFVVTLDGVARRVAAARFVYRGPGARSVAAAAASAEEPALAEPSRVVVLAVDDRGVSAEQERSARAALRAVLDMLGPEDGASVVALSRVPKTVALTPARQGLREAAERMAVCSSAAVPTPDDRRPDGPTGAARGGEETPAGSGGALPRQSVELADRSPGLARELAATGTEDGAPRPPSAETSLTALSGIINGLRRIPGPKHVVVLTGTPDSESGPADAPSLDAIRVAAAHARVQVHAVHVRRPSQAATARRALDGLARDTGGWSVWTSGNGGGLGLLTSALGGSYRIELSLTPGGMPGEVHDLRIAVRRPGTQVTSPTRWVQRDDPAPETVTAPAAPPERPTGAAPAAEGEPGRRVDPVPGTVVTLRRPAVTTPPEVRSLLARVSAYLSDYLNAFSMVVAEEEYVQVLSPPFGIQLAASKLRRTLVSDLLLVRVDGPDTWVPFRDVVSVDGVPIGDRAERLQRLFLEEPGRAMRESRRITDEGARYNIGSVYRTINLPTLPLVFLMPAHVDGFRFQRAGEEELDGVTTVRLDYRETGRKTVLRHAETNANLAASGTYWIEPATGRILKTTLAIGDGRFVVTTTVTYTWNDALGLLMPAQMTELYRQGDERLFCTATYRNFRRFQVTTHEELKREAR